MGEYTVYAIRNLVDGRVYIGRTRQYRIRMNAHRGWARRGQKVGTPLYDAMREFGIDAFEFKVLAEGLDLSQADAAEIRFIDEFGARFPSTGYNTTPGGHDYAFRATIALASRQKLKADDPEEYYRKNSERAKKTAALTPAHVRSDRAKRRDAKLTDEQKSARGKAGFAGTTAEGRRAAALKRAAAWSPEYRNDLLSKMQAAIRAKRAGMTEQERRQIAIKGWEARRSKAAGNK